MDLHAFMSVFLALVSRLKRKTFKNSIYSFFLAFPGEDETVNSLCGLVSDRYVKEAYGRTLSCFAHF